MTDVNCQYFRLPAATLTSTTDSSQRYGQKLPKIWPSHGEIQRPCTGNWVSRRWLGELVSYRSPYPVQHRRIHHLKLLLAEAAQQRTPCHESGESRYRDYYPFRRHYKTSCSVRISSNSRVSSRISSVCANTRDLKRQDGTTTEPQPPIAAGLGQRN